jgi:transcriptional regulator with XRE-family HTH domain
MNEKTLVQRIKETCDSKDINISKLEQDLEFSSGLISRWDKSSPSIDRVVAVSRYLETSTDYLLGLKDERPNTLKSKFVQALFERTENYEIYWKKLGDKSIYGNKILNKLFDKTFNNEPLIFQESDTYISSFNGTAIYIAERTQLSIGESDTEYVLFLQFDENEDDSNFSIVSYDTHELKALYNSIRQNLISRNTATQEKTFIESFLNNYTNQNTKLKLKLKRPVD